MASENAELAANIELALKRIQNVSMAMSRCRKRIYLDELKKIRKYGGQIKSARYGGKHGVSVIVFDMTQADLDRYSYRRYRIGDVFAKAFRDRRLNNG